MQEEQNKEHSKIQAQSSELQSGEIGQFLKSKGVSFTPLGNDKTDIEMISLDTKDLVNVCTILKKSPETSFDFLVLITSNEVKSGYQSIYSLHCTKSKKSFRIKVTVPKENPIVPTVSHIWSTADWYEREGYDMMGIIYAGHPNLKRILNPENWKGFPLRKDYIPPSDSLNGPHPLRETKYAESTLSNPS